MKEEKIKELNSKLNKYNYGMILDGKPIIGYDLDFTKYKTISPENFAKYKIGVCWDYVEYEAICFSKNIGMRLTTYKLLQNETFSLYYMQHIDQSGCMPTHTWLGYKLNDSIYSFESSWRSIQGIKKHTSELSMIEYYLEQQEKYHREHKNRLYNHVILKYITMPKYNLTPDEYMNIILDTGVVIHSTIKSYPSVLQL